MAFGKLLGECFFVVCHTPLELLFCNINIFNLNVEILSGRKAIPFFCHFFVGWSNRELLYHLLVSENIYNLRYLIGTEIRLLVLPYFDSLTKFARINKYRLFGLVLIDKTTLTFVPVLAKTLLGILTTPFRILLSTRCLRILNAMPLLAVMNPVGTTIAPLPVSFKLYSKC